ncbi:MAG: efflux RND transporter periplasmic adaptor subunit [Thiolinea sp.]
MSASTAQSMGYASARCKNAPARSIDTVGYVGYDEDKLHHLHVTAAGWVKNPVVRTLGEQVKQGQLLASYYAPQIYTAQRITLTALRAASDRQRQIDVRTRLRVMEIPDAIIQRSGAAGRDHPADAGEGADFRGGDAYQCPGRRL